jgi:hypothetical protein
MLLNSVPLCMLRMEKPTQIAIAMAASLWTADIAPETGFPEGLGSLSARSRLIRTSEKTVKRKSSPLEAMMYACGLISLRPHAYDIPKRQPPVSDRLAEIRLLSLVRAVPC